MYLEEIIQEIQELKAKLGIRRDSELARLLDWDRFKLSRSLNIDKQKADAEEVLKVLREKAKEKGL